jgi:Spy/CpxP family protein refolding chaperone
MKDADTGVTMAFRDAIRALIKTHPDMDAIATQMLHEREESIALLLGQGYSDAAIEAYRDTMDSLRPHADGSNMNPP